MSYEGQAPPPSGFPDNGNQQAPQGVTGNVQGGQAPQAAYGQPAPYQQPGQQAPAPAGYGQQAPAPGGYGQQGGYAAQPQGPGQYAPGQGAGPQAPAAPRPNPFVGIPVSDFVRDGIAALLLLVSFALPVTTRWNIDSLFSGGMRIEGVGDRFHFIVILVTVLSLLSLSLPYLARANVFPPSWTVHTTRKVRLLANAPYVIVVLVYVVLDAITSDETTGVGTIFALGLAGAVLAAQPRQCEMGPVDLDRDVSRLWWSITAAIGGFIALTYVASLIFFLVDVGEFADIFTSTAVVGAILAWVFAVVFSLWAIYGTVIQRSQSWRLVLIGLGVILVCAVVFGAGEDSSLVKVESLRAISFTILQPLSLQEGLGAIFLPAAAAAAAAPATVRSLTAEPRAKSWIFAAVHGLDYIVFVAGATVLTAALWFFFDDRFFDGIERPTGVLVTTIILGLLTIGAAVYGRMALAKDPAAGRVPALGAVGAAFVLGIVILIMVPSETIFSDDKIVTVGHLLLAFGLPALVVIALTGPKPVREYFASNRRAPQAATAAAYQWTAPAAPAPGYQYPGQPGDQAGHGGTAPAQQPYGASVQSASWQTQSAPAVQPQQSQQAQQDQQGRTQEGAHPDAPDNTAQTVKLAKVDGTDGHAADDERGTEAPESHAVSSGFTSAQALDPATPGAVLAQIVQDAPELRAQVAANPSTYPALLGWLGQLGDPEIDAALRNRQS